MFLRPTLWRLGMIVIGPLLSLASQPAGPTAGGWLLVANKGDHTLGIVDPDAGRQVAAVPVEGITGHEVVASPDGRTAYVPIYGDSGVGKPGTDGRTLTVIDVGDRRVTKTIDFGRPVRPHCAVFGPKNGLLYVTAELTDSIDVIDPHTLKIVGSIPTSQKESHMLAITRDGKRGYTANVGPGTVSAIDLEAKRVITVIPVSGETQRISLSVDDRLAFTADQTKPQLAVIDTATNTMKTWVPLPAPGYGTAATRDGRWLLVALPSAGKVGVVDLKSLKLERTVDVPKSPQEVLVRPDNKVAYVSCHESKKVAAINLSTWQVAKVIDAGSLADGLAWAQRD